MKTGLCIFFRTLFADKKQMQTCSFKTIHPDSQTNSPIYKKSYSDP